MPQRPTKDAPARPFPPSPPAPPSVSLESALAADTRPLTADQAPTPRPAAPATLGRGGLRAGLFAVLAIGLIPALVGTAWYLRHLRDLALQDAYQQTDLIALATAESLHWLMQDAQAMLTAIAARPRVRAMNAGDCDPIFLDFRDTNPTFKALALRRLDGRSVCSELQRPPSQQSVASASWFQAAVRAEGFYATDAHMGAVAQTWTTRLTAPVVGTSDQIEGLLITPVELKQLQQRVFHRLPASAVVAVLDASNHIVLRSAAQDERVGKPATATVAREVSVFRDERAAAAMAPTPRWQFAETGIGDVRRLYSVRPVPKTGWMVVAAVDEAVTLEGYRASRNRALIAVLAVLALTAWAARHASLSILRPMQGLARAARGVAAGDSSQRAPESGPREVREVAREFNRMVAATTESAQRLRASEDHYRTLLQNLPVAVVAHRPDSAIEVFNERACALLRMTPDQLAGRTAVDRAWHFVDERGERLTPAAYPVSRVLDTGRSMPAEVLGIVSAGLPGSGEPEAQSPHTWVMVTGYPQFDEHRQLVRALIVFVDVTAQRESEELRRDKESAEAASKAKSAFLSRVSHELRTPLNAINGFSELLLMDTQLAPNVKAKIGHVHNAGRHLLSLINQILDLTRIESGHLPTSLQPTPLQPLLADCLAVCGPLAEARQVSLHGAWPVEAGDAWRVTADPLHLRQILMNLLANAIKYNRPLGRVDVTVEADAERVRVTVADTGLGLTPAQIANLFQPFNRLGAEYGIVEGSGLGLSISRLLAGQMGAEISVDSVPGTGTRFHVLLPRAVAAPPV